jgi:uncharacterized membrane protein YeaQ/YmgE (transglycosylase-associated protein family)
MNPPLTLVDGRFHGMLARERAPCHGKVTAATAVTLSAVLIIGIIGFGILAGWLAQLILGRGTGNWAEALVAGLVGSFVGGLVLSLLFGDGFNLRASGIIGSILGAVIVLVVWGAIRGRSARAASR